MKTIFVFLAVLCFVNLCSAQVSNYGNSNATDGSTGLVVIGNSTFGNGAFTNGASPNSQSQPASCGVIKTFISTFVPGLNCSTTG